MDLPLWNLSDDHGYLPSYPSSYYNEEHSLYDFCFGYGRDLIEEHALNEKSCLQVLKILMNKADEDIVKLEEDIVMLHCQLAWDDEDWSVPCSAALREKIERLDILIKCLEKESTSDVHYPDLQLELPVEQPQSLHDILKPLLENYLVKRKQSESSVMQVPVLPAVGLGNSKSEARTSKHCIQTEENECAIVLKTNGRKNQSMELEELKLNDPQQVSLFAPNPFNPMEKDSSASTSIEKGNTREVRRNNDKEVISKAKVAQHGLELESKVTNSHLKPRETEMQISDISKVDYMKQRTETPSNVRKARVYRRAINKTVHSTKALVKMKRKDTNFPETTEAFEAEKTGRTYSIGAFNDTIEHAREPNMKLGHHVKHEIETLVINQAKSISHTEPKGQGPKMNCKAKPEIVQHSYVAKNVDVGSLATVNLKEQHKYGVLEKIKKNVEKKTQPQLKGTKIDATPEVRISSPQKLMELSLSSKTITKKRGLRDFLIKLVKPEHDTSSITTEEVTDDAGDVAQNSSVCIKDVERLTLNDLKAIAKNRKMQGYSKLRKAELQKYLGLEPYLNMRQKACENTGMSPASTI